MDILVAAQEGSLQGVCDALQAGVPVDTTDENGVTVLMWASRNGHDNVVEKLLAAGANPNHQNENGVIALMWASANGHDNVVEKLLEAGANHDHQTNDGLTALMCASKNGHINIVEKLLAGGANHNHQHEFGKTALMWASWNGHENVVEMLLAAGANHDHQNKEGITALILASGNGHVNVVEKLLAVRADYDHEDKVGRTALIWAFRNGHAGVMEKLLEAGANLDDLSNPSHQDEEGRTALIWASLHGHDVEKLLAAGANPNHQDKYGQTALIRASLNGHVNVVEKLLAAGADHDHQDKEGMTALNWASEASHVDIVRMLEAAGAQHKGYVMMEWVKVHTNKRVQHESSTGIDGDYFYFKGGSIGIIKILEPMNPQLNYYEYLIVSRGQKAGIGIGVGERAYPMDHMPGWKQNSCGYHADNLIFGSGRVTKYGPTCTDGDRMGCGVDFSTDHSSGYVNVFFTKNGKQVGDVIQMEEPKDGLYPLIGLYSRGEKVKYLGHCHRVPDWNKKSTKQDPSSLENQSHYEACQQALKEEVAIPLKYLKVLFFGPPRTGKSSMRRRLVGEIQNLTKERVQEIQKLAKEHVQEIQNLAKERIQASTGTAEVHEVVVKKINPGEDKTTTSTAVITKSKWSSVKGVFGKEKSTYELDDELRLLYQFIYCEKEKRAKEWSEERSKERSGERSEERSEKRSSVTDPGIKPTKEIDTVPNSKSLQANPDAHEDEKHTEEKDEIEKAFEAIKKVLHTPRQEQLKILLDGTILMNMVDTGGQPAFLEMLPALTIGPALYLIFFRLDQGLKARCPVLYGIEEKNITFDDSYTNEGVIFQALSSIACFSCTEANPAMLSTHSDLPNPSHAAMLVGTHKDQLIGTHENEQIGTHKDELGSIPEIVADKIKEKIKEKNDELEDTLGEIGKGFLERASIGQLMFAVDNMNGDETELTAVRERLEHIIDCTFKGIKIPASWLMFSIFIRRMGCRTMNLSECRKIGNKLNVPDIKVALWFLHRHVGILMHFPEVEEIKDIVICDPQVVFDRVTDLIVESFELSNVRTNVWEEFKTTGQFSSENIQNKSDSLSQLQLVKLLEYLNIIAPIRCLPQADARQAERHSLTPGLSPQSDAYQAERHSLTPGLSPQSDAHQAEKHSLTPGLSPQSDAHQAEKLPFASGLCVQHQKYFMPAVLKHADEEQLCMEQRSTDLIPLIIHFKCGYVPVGVFCAMIARLVAQEDTLEWELLKPSKHGDHILCKNRVTFRMYCAYDITLVSRPKWYEIHVICDPEAIPFKTLGEVSQEVVHTVCDTLDEVISKMRYKHLTSFRSSETLYELGFKCPIHPDDDHLVINRPMPMKGVKASPQSAKYLWLNYLGKKSIMRCLGKGLVIGLPSSAQYLGWFEKAAETSPVPSVSIPGTGTSYGSGTEETDYCTGQLKPDYRGALSSLGASGPPPSSTSLQEKLNEKPTNKALTLLKWNDGGKRKKLRVTDEISNQWKKIGKLLEIPEPTLDGWWTQTHNHEECCDKVLGNWLQNPPEDYPATWDGLIELLDDAKFTDLAKILKKAVENKV